MWNTASISMSQEQRNKWMNTKVEGENLSVVK